MARWLPRVNTFLLISILLVNAYILLLPLMPWIQFWLKSRSATAVTLQAIASPNKAEMNTVSDPLAGSNHITAPTMLLNEPIYTGSTKSTLNKGIWLRPNGSTPDKGGNTILAAHRFTYTDPEGTFYFLNKLRPNDPIAIEWQNKRYRYIVQQSKIVSANETSVELPTETPQLTLYTCTPLWNPKDRLVVIATLEQP